MDVGATSQSGGPSRDVVLATACCRARRHRGAIRCFFVVFVGAARSSRPAASNDTRVVTGNCGASDPYFFMHRGEASNEGVHC